MGFIFMFMGGGEISLNRSRGMLRLIIRMEGFRLCLDEIVIKISIIIIIIDIIIVVFCW